MKDDDTPQVQSCGQQSRTDTTTTRRHFVGGVVATALLPMATTPRASEFGDADLLDLIKSVEPPFITVEMAHQRTPADVSREEVRRRAEDLQERGVLAVKEPEPGAKLWWLA